MKNTISMVCIFAALFLTIATTWDDGQSYCVIFPQNGRDIFGVAQRNIILIGDDEISLIPQVNFEGDAHDFGILVPVPAEPRLATVGANVFNEASFLTQPITRQSSSGCGCNEETQFNDGPFFNRVAFDDAASVESGSGGVTVVYEQFVGMYQAVVLQATDAGDLTDWLNDNNYHFNPDDSGILQDYVTRNWFFVAMKLDTAKVPSYVDRWWSATTSPAKITFEHSSSSLTYPLKISAISTDERTDVLVYTIGKDPMQFPGAKVEYANIIDQNEATAISENYPQFATLVAAGSFLTKLRKTFTKAEMNQDIEITKSDDRREYRDIRYVNDRGVVFAALGLLALGITLRRKKYKQY